MIISARVAAPAALALGVAAAAGAVALGPQTASAAPSSTLSLTTSSDQDSFTGPGQTIAFSYVVTNNGTQTLYNVGIQDPLTGLSDISCPNSVLDAGASQTCTATYTTTQADADQGFVNDLATASGELPSQGGTVTSAPARLTVPDAVTPAVPPAGGGVTVVPVPVPFPLPVGGTRTSTGTGGDVGGVGVVGVGGVGGPGGPVGGAGGAGPAGTSPIGGAPAQVTG